MPTTLLAVRSARPALRHRGKVRDVFDLAQRRADARRATLLMVATDRLSAFDVVLPDPIPARARCSARSAISGSTRPRT
jgi:phosphoribosylaminoimidazole-succinocarboxamide synthase